MASYKNINRAGRAFQDDPFGDASEELDGIELIDLTGVDEVELDHPQLPASRVNKSLRNYPLDGDHRSVKHVAVNGIKYQVGQFAELHELVGIYKIQFIEIKSINVHNRTEDVVIRGLPYARTRNLHDCLPRKCSEVCLVLEVDSDDARPDEDQALLQIAPEQLMRKRILTNTNKSFPECRFDPHTYITDELKEHQAPLACRWTMVAEYKDASQRRACRPQGQAFEHLSERDSHKIKRRNLGVDDQRSREWHGDKILGGSKFECQSVEGESEDSEPAFIQKYSFADISAGPGGASRGAEMAGFMVVLATENCRHACDSYRANFPDVEFYRMDANEVAADENQYTVDVLHISVSDLSAPGKDEKTVYKLCTDLLKKFLARVVVMDQPTCIASDRNVHLLNAITLSFTDAGYSMQWKLVNMVDYGLPQMQQRIVIIGTGPGETLASWPAVTHSSDPTGDQQPFVTEEEAISGLNHRLHSLHDPKALPVIKRIKQKARDADQPMEFIFNTNGSTAFPHADGKRGFTLRELACLQGFPTYHEFAGSHIRKQIATAFPSSVAMAFYQHIRQHLEEVDGVGSGQPEPDAPAEAPSALFSEANNFEVGDPQSREAPSASGTPDEAIPDAMQPLRSNENLVRSASRQRIEAATLPLSPDPTMSPATQQNAGSMSPVSQTPSPAQQLPTPSTRGQSIAGQRAAALRLRRDRAAFEEAEGDGDDDDDGNSWILQTPSKRPRTSSVYRERSHSSSRDGSRTISSFSDDEAGLV